MKLPSIKSCPFCNTENTDKLTLLIIVETDKKDYFVVCTCCNATGPTGGFNEEEAIICWNERY